MKPNPPTSQRRRPRPEERGFALLLVFLIAAGIAISLYMELPRVAFESQRNREEMLIERGEEYTRAIELFYRKTRRYPQKIEELESFNDRRFLRKRYKDPLTGKDEWREIHMGAAGLTDSLVEKPGGLNTKAAGTGTGTESGAGGSSAAGTGDKPLLGPDGQPIPPEVNSVVARTRPSDKMPVRGVGTPGQFGPGYDPNNPNNAQLPQDPNNPNNNPNPDPNQAPLPNNPNGPQQPPPPPGQFPVTAYPGQPGINPGGVQPGGGGLPPFGQPGSPGFPVQPPPGGPNAAINAINNSLRNPQQPGFISGQPQQQGGNSSFGQSISSSGFNQPTSTTANQGNNPFSGGIAGVASLQTGVGIKRYNERSKYKEWEFVFDYRKPKGKAAGAAGMPTGTPTNNPFGGATPPPSTSPPPPPSNR